MNLLLRGMYKSEKLLRRKEEPRPLHKQASCRASREEGEETAPAPCSPGPKPPSYRLSPLSSHNPKQASPHLRDYIHPCHFQETRCSESILAFLWTHRNNSLTHRTERDDLVIFIFKMIKMQPEQFLWPTQARSAGRLIRVGISFPSSSTVLSTWACKSNPR